MMRSRRRRQYRRRKQTKKVVDVAIRAIRQALLLIAARDLRQAIDRRMVKSFPHGGIELKGPVTVKENDYIVRTHEQIL